MTQITGINGDGATPVPRNLLWDWQANVRHGLEIMARKQANATDFIGRQRAQMLAERAARGEPPLPPPVITSGRVTFRDGTGRIMEHAQAIKAYNGGSFCCWDNPNGRWVVKPAAVWIDADGERHENPYVSKICAEIEESSNPPIDPLRGTAESGCAEGLTTRARSDSTGHLHEEHGVTELALVNHPLDPAMAEDVGPGWECYIEGTAWGLRHEGALGGAQ